MISTHCNNYVREYGRRRPRKERLSLLVLLVVLPIRCEAIIENVDLSALSSSTGFAANGATGSDLSGNAVSGAGDINGDGIDDVIIGAPGVSPVVGGVTRASAGCAYVIFGSTASSSSSAYMNLDLATFATSGSPLGFAIYGAVATDNIGFTVSRAGDVNDDGVADIILGSQAASPVVNSAARAGAGISYVIFGRSVLGGAAAYANIDLLPLNTAGSTLGFAIYGALTNDHSGYSVSAAGDVNNDGVDDVIIGAFQSTPVIGGTPVSQAGVSYVVFGRTGGPVSYTNIDLLPIFTSGSAVGFAIYGITTGEYSGRAVSGGGDINKDGISDVIVGAVYASPLVSGAVRSSAGATYVIFGRSYLTGAVAYANVNLADLVTAGSNIGFIVQGGVAGESSGRSVSNAGDVNGDGASDFILGARLANVGIRASAGISYVIFGRDAQLNEPASHTNIDLLAIASAGSPLGFAIYGSASSDYCGQSVGGGGDINGDGLSDLIVGAINADPIVSLVTRANAGISYVIYGRSVGTGAAAYANIDLANLNIVASALGFAILGAAAGNNNGQFVSYAGDVNHDGTSDVIVGAHLASINGVSSGSSYVVFGVSTFPTVVPSERPSALPTVPPAAPPSHRPSYSPSALPSSHPSAQPSALPSSQPSRQPTSQPSLQPSRQPSTQPSGQPSSRPTMQPSGQPSRSPSVQPTARPSAKPSGHPSSQPSEVPSAQPSTQPSVQPSSLPSTQPSARPSEQPLAAPTSQPSEQPSSQPTVQPSARPSTQPSELPSAQPTAKPSSQPSSQPSEQPTTQPSSQPTGEPSGQPSSVPSLQPSALPTAMPSKQPSVQPTMQPSAKPSDQPTSQPSSQPLATPSNQPFTQPSSQPSVVPSSQPSTQPTAHPSLAPLREWETTVSDDVAMLSRVFGAGGNVWACGGGDKPTAQCVVAAQDSGEIVSLYQFGWSRVTSVLDTNSSTIVISGQGVNGTVATAEVASCVLGEIQQMHCKVVSLHDTRFLSASFVPMTKVIVYVGWHNVYTSISVVDPISSTVRSYLYSTYNTRALTLSQVQSPPHFPGSFVAGTAVRATATPVNYIVAGMVRADGGIMSAMVLMPQSGNIISSDDLVNAMALDPIGPDSFIAGGLQVSNDTTTHAYVVRANALYMQIQYCMRYKAVLTEGRRILNTQNVNAVPELRSAVRGMVLVESVLFLVVDRTTTFNTTALTVLKTSVNTGAIIKQVHIAAPNATSLTCTDIASTGLLLSLVCTVNNMRSLLLAVDHELSFEALPQGFVRSEEDRFQAEAVPFMRTVLSVTKTDATISTARTEFDLAGASPTQHPVVTPSLTPSAKPSSAPSSQPSSSPSAAPSVSARPTSQPSTSRPTNTPKPSVDPTFTPTEKPIVAPTVRPSLSPTGAPSVPPTLRPSAGPSARPSVVVTVQPTVIPTAQMSTAPVRPSARPTILPTSKPSTTSSTSLQPSEGPTVSAASDHNTKSNSNTPYIVGGSVGGGLLLLVIGYLVSRYSRDEEKIKVNELRRLEFRRQQALLAEQERAETAKYLQEEQRKATKGGKRSRIAPARAEDESKIGGNLHEAPSMRNIPQEHVTMTAYNPSLNTSSPSLLYAQENSSVAHLSRARLASIGESSEEESSEKSSVSSSSNDTRSATSY